MQMTLLSNQRSISEGEDIGLRVDRDINQNKDATLFKEKQDFDIRVSHGKEKYSKDALSFRGVRYEIYI